MSERILFLLIITGFVLVNFVLIRVCIKKHMRVEELETQLRLERAIWQRDW